MKKKVLAATIVVATAGGAGVAWAVLGGTITLPGAAEGLALSLGNSSCQVGSINWTVPTPTFNTTTTQYEVSAVNFTGFNAGCVSVSAALDLQVIDSNGVFLTTGNATPGATSGTISIAPVPFDDMTGASFIYLVSE